MQQLGPSIERILIILDEDPTISPPYITDAESITINNTIKQAIEAGKIRKRKPTTALDRATETAIAELLENPAGLSKAALLVVSESENIVSLILKIRGKLKLDNLYTLEKRGKGKSLVYFLKSRMGIDSGSLSSQSS